MIIDPRRERYDVRIDGKDLKQGDRLHLTVIGGDEYFTVTKVENLGDAGTFWEATGVADMTGNIMPGQKVWIKK